MDPEKSLASIITFHILINLQLVLADLSAAGQNEKNSHSTNLLSKPHFEKQFSLKLSRESEEEITDSVNSCQYN